MSERLSPQVKPRGFSGQTLRMLALLFLLAGIVGRTILEQKILGVTNSSYEEMLAVLESSDSYFKIATGAIILKMVQTCAVPLFVFLLVEGAKHTGCYWKYFLRVLGVAVISEIPYDLACFGKWLDLGEQNPVFGLVIAMVMIFLFKSYAGRGIKSVLINILAVVLALVWVNMLKISEGLPMILIATGLWFTRNRKGLQVLVGAVVTCVCITPSVEYMRYFFAPLVFMVIHFYNEEPGERNRIMNYGAYPFLLMAVWMFAKFAF